MRFAYAGIDFLGDVFAALVEKGWQPVKLFTRPCDNLYDFNDAVVTRARRQKIPIQLSRLKPEDFADLKARRCEALVVAGYPWLIKGWEPHLRYAFNIHPSPLPFGRGPYPLFQAILEGVSEWGVTAHVLSPEFDQGAVVAQETFAVAADETHDSLLAKCQMGSRRLSLRLAAGLPELWAAGRPQEGGSYWPRIADRDRTLDWTQPVERLLRTVRAFGSIEAVAKLNGSTVYVRGAAGWTEPHRHRPGSVVHSYRRHLVVAVADGFVQLTDWSAVSLTNARDLGR